ncbi:MAG: tRNA (N6-isopentenyl adenosine(37)-C2)-methylthiotransferase MiaB [Anaerolineae bacterium]|nr:tRNA (N6-isopentenyl adenosine(37)-C2)-methylthiotransferase MiaB [Anaerolineae bacterium]
MQTFYVWTIGCQMNFADSWRLEQELRRLGYRQAPRAERADLVVLNTCVVRQHAEDKCVGRLTSLRGWKRRNPHGLLAVMGCFVGDMDELESTYPYVDLFIKPSAFMDLVHYLCDHDLVPERQDIPPFESVPVSMHVPISYGCDHHCTYCIVRIRRGREQSRPISEVVQEVADLVNRGVREVTLLGQNVDSYGHDLPAMDMLDGKTRQPTLADLLYAVHVINDLDRIRFLTSHPADMKPEVIRAVADLPRVCPHFELPIQAGDDRVLQRMARGYTVAQFKSLIAQIRALFPADQVAGCSIATDVIVGFPGETTEQYEATYRLLEELRFDAVHVAAYSVRPGTPAARLQDDVPQQEKERRRQAIDDLQGRIVGEINAHFMGKTVEVLVEEKRQDRWQGRTVTNKLVYFNDEENDWQGKLAQVRITWTGPWSMIGEPAKFQVPPVTSTSAL